MIMPSRDMIVRQGLAARTGRQRVRHRFHRLQHRGMIGPILFGWIMDNAAPVWIFYAAIAVHVGHRRLRFS